MNTYTHVCISVEQPHELCEAVAALGRHGVPDFPPENVDLNDFDEVYVVEIRVGGDTLFAVSLDTRYIGPYVESLEKKDDSSNGNASGQGD